MSLLPDLDDMPTEGEHDANATNEPASAAPTDGPSGNDTSGAPAAPVAVRAPASVDSHAAIAAVMLTLGALLIAGA